MRVYALIAWWDESPTWLNATIASSAAFCDHVVAVDGAYALYPSGPRSGGSSGPEQHEAIAKTCEALGLGLTLYVPPGPWEGNEVEKRSAMFRLAEALAEPWVDWYFTIDADEVVLEAPRDLRDRLAGTAEHAATVTLMQSVWTDTGDWNHRHGDAHLNVTPVRQFFRAVPGLTVDGAHHFYVSHEHDLWLRGHGGDLDPAADMPDVLLEHRNHLRPGRRQGLQANYYRARDAAGVEAVPVRGVTSGR